METGICRVVCAATLGGAGGINTFTFFDKTLGVGVGWGGGGDSSVVRAPDS